MARGVRPRWPETNRRGQGAQSVAVRKRDIEMFKVLLERGADVNWENEIGTTPLETAAAFGSAPAASKVFTPSRWPMPAATIKAVVSDRILLVNQILA